MRRELTITGSPAPEKGCRAGDEDSGPAGSNLVLASVWVACQYLSDVRQGVRPFSDEQGEYSRSDEQ